jgi:hypothetical protein
MSQRWETRDVIQQCGQSDKIKEELMGRSAGYLFQSIIDTLIDDLLNSVSVSKIIYLISQFRHRSWLVLG